MLLLDHEQAFGKLRHLREYTARWRQWTPGGDIDFDPGVSAEDQAKVEAWVKAASA
jgi:hypothetical protein